MTTWVAVDVLLLWIVLLRSAWLGYRQARLHENLAERVCELERRLEVPGPAPEPNPIILEWYRGHMKESKREEGES